MEFSGFQKLDLVNYPSHVAASVFTGGCNLRCPYCHNPELARGISQERYPEEEILEYLSKRKAMLEGLVISGGEPTLHHGLASFISKVRELGLDVKLDTNGLRPDVLKDLLKNNLLDYVAVDIKGPAQTYAVLGAKQDATEIMALMKESLDALRAWSDKAWEVRTTYLEQLIPDSDIPAMVALAGQVPVWHLQAFNPAVTLDGEWGSYSSPTAEKLEQVASLMADLGVNVKIR